METSTDRIKILIATGLYAPEIGGPATYVAMLEEHLPRRGIDLMVMPFSQVRKYPKMIRHFIYAIKLYSASREADAIYALDPVSVGLPAMLVARLTGKNLYLRIAGDYAWEQGQSRFGVTDSLDEFVSKKHEDYSVPVQVLRQLERKVARAAKRIVVPSDYMKGVVAKWGIREEKIVRIYSAVHPLPFSKKTEPQEESSNEAKAIIVTAGRLVPWKGIATLIDVIKDLKEKGRIVKLIVAGDGPLRESLENKIKSEDLQDQVTLAGRLDKSELAETIRSADVFILNTEYEGLSHQLLEVMDTGVPVITTDVGGNPELIENHMSGLLVSFDDKDALAGAVLNVLDNKELRVRFVQNARLKLADFTETKVIDQIVHEVLNWVVKK